MYFFCRWRRNPGLQIFSIYKRKTKKLGKTFQDGDSHHNKSHMNRGCGLQDDCLLWEPRGNKCTTILLKKIIFCYAFWISLKCAKASMIFFFFMYLSCYFNISPHFLNATNLFKSIVDLVFFFFLFIKYAKKEKLCLSEVYLYPRHAFSFIIIFKT